MSFVASESDPDTRRFLLEARDARQRALDQALARAHAARAASVCILTTNIPGPSKHRPGVSRLFREATQALSSLRGWQTLLSGADLLGPFRIGSSLLSPFEAKTIAVSLETGSPSGRLLDADVYRTDGQATGREMLGFAPRSCLVCTEPAADCIRLRRHAESELLERVDSLLGAFVSAPVTLVPERLAELLVHGAVRELDLTPKPGLVDRHDVGSHPDLSYEAMRASAELLSIYFDEILRCWTERRPLPYFVEAGIRAEDRMTRKIGSNAHKGFIFLSGLVLMATCESNGRVDLLRQKISEISARFFERFQASSSHGREIRDRYGLGGIRAEAENGFPSVFDRGLPAYREAMQAGWEPRRADFYLMAVLMQTVEDTTAVRRCGLEGLSRLRADGARLKTLLERDLSPGGLLVQLNDDYRRVGLTMGGVADCMGLTFALHDAATWG